MLVAVGGGAAAIKAPALLRRLREAGHEVRALASQRALAFVGELSLALAAGRPAATDAGWFAASGGVQHIELARWAELILVAPATADAMARAASGQAGDLLSAVLLAGSGKVVWVPAMNPAMWAHSATQANRLRLVQFGQVVLEPAFGNMAMVGEEPGVGRMLEPQEIVGHLDRVLLEQDLAGLTVLVTAGPTREFIDPVRFISNPSSGYMGYALATAARDRGAKVTLVSGPVGLPEPTGMEVRRVTSALEMHAVAMSAFGEAKVVIAAAAVADYRVAQPAPEKEAKSPSGYRLDLVPNPDILAEMGRLKGERVLVGFAMETSAGVERAQDKALSKNLDFICLNYPTRARSAFGSQDNEVTLVFPDGRSELLQRMPKPMLAHRILDYIYPLIKGSV